MPVKSRTVLLYTDSKSETLSVVAVWQAQISKSLQKIYASVNKFGKVIVSSDQYDFAIQKRKDRRAQIIVALPNKNMNNMTLTFQKRISTKLTSIYGCSLLPGDRMKRKDRQAQIMIAFPTRNIDNLTLKLQKRINTGLSNVHSCSLLPGDRMIFSSSSQHKIKVLKSDGSKDFQIKKIGPTFNVIFSGDDSIAVTSGCSNQINIFDLKKHKLKKSITVNSYNAGLVYKDGHLIYCARQKGIQMISLNDETITNISDTELPDFPYITALGDKLYYTHYRNHSVTCCDYHGNTLWTFCERNVLMSPLSISVDNDGNVYVAGFDTNNVVVISPDGQHFRQLLSSENGLRLLWVLHYDKSTNKLLVANRSNKAFLFDIK
ncbi:uncharacterized protein LOC134687785 [Mytilus trossulus]|uniref:uncharacterized protein LOC134687785 n=1 Tax=Mytilus trossulus TaxID=6551 RepID=UPI003003DD2B